MAKRVRQVDVMRELCTQLGGDQEAVIAAYAAAEQRGEVPRRSNIHGFTAEKYALRLWQDGVSKGWLLR